MGRLEEYLIAADNPIGKKQRIPFFRRKRAGEELTREQVAAIKAGRKLLRKEMKAQGIKDKSDFELTATNMGLYFDKQRWWLWLLWFFHGKGLATLVGSTVLLTTALFAYSAVTQMQGHFTINMSDGMFKEGFILSETPDFVNATTHLFATPAEGVPCVSISQLPDFLDRKDGRYNETYFAYTFYMRNEGETVVDYVWKVNLNSESKNLSSATWVMIFEDGEMLFYARPNSDTGRPEALPAYDDNSRGYVRKPLSDRNKDPNHQYQLVKEGDAFDFWRVVPMPFISDYQVAEGMQIEVGPGDVHKYTVVIWLEGDDPDCTDELIGGHVGMEFYAQLLREEEEEQKKKNGFWSALVGNE